MFSKMPKHGLLMVIYSNMTTNCMASQSSEFSLCFASVDAANGLKDIQRDIVGKPTDGTVAHQCVNSAGVLAACNHVVVAIGRVWLARKF
jgi:hypothetical protein